jgi:hypothetical protein
MCGIRSTVGRAWCLYCEGNRLVQNLQPLRFSWGVAHPCVENVAWNSTFGGLSNQFQDTVHALFETGSRVGDVRERPSTARGLAASQHSATKSPFASI